MRLSSVLVTVCLGLALASCGETAKPKRPSTQQESCVPTFTPTATDGAAVEAYCSESNAAICARAFGDCTAELADWGQYFTDQQDCTTQLAAVCAEQTDGYILNTADGAACTSATNTATCAALIQGDPATFGACQTAQVAVPPAPAGAAQITAGTTSGTITGNETTQFDGKAAVTYAMCLTASSTVDIEVLAPASGGIADSVLVLFDGDGTPVAYNDDKDPASDDYLSLISGYVVENGGPHLIVVTTYDGSETGDFDLQVTAQ